VERQQTEGILEEAGLSRVEVIVHAPQWGNLRADFPSASLLTKSPAVTCRVSDLLFALRKSILRVRARRGVRPRVLESEEELGAYFSLRYRVWKECGYLAPEKDDPKSQWELDFTDRTSLPLGFFSGDTLVACGRLVRGLGEEFPKYVSLINSLIDRQGSAELRRYFSYPQHLAHPFDVLKTFAEFPGYYCHLVRDGRSKAEVSRIIVDPHFRGHGLGEVLVDSLVTLAETYGIEVLFLACHEFREAFYGRCGFQAIPGMRADRFLAIRDSVIAMDRCLKTARKTEEARSACSET